MEHKVFYFNYRLYYQGMIDKHAAWDHNGYRLDRKSMNEWNYYNMMLPGMRHMSQIFRYKKKVIDKQYPGIYRLYN